MLTEGGLMNFHTIIINDISNKKGIYEVVLLVDALSHSKNSMSFQILQTTNLYIKSSFTG